MSDGVNAIAGVGGGDDLARRDVANAHKPLHLGRWALWLIVLVIAADLAWIIGNNENFGWPIVAQWFTAGSVLQGLEVTLGLSIVSMIIGVLLGLALAVARMSKDRLLSSLAGLYIWFFRGVPLLVQLIFWYNLSTLFPRLGIGIPFEPMLVSWDTNSLITPMTAAIAGLALNETAYMAEIIRGGLLSVDAGQIEATEAFGMTRARALRRIILPQAMRSIVPPTGNQFINLIKATSLVSVIAMSDLLYTVQAVYNRTFQVIPMLLVAVLWYLLITSILNIGQGFIERYYARGERGAGASLRKNPAADAVEKA
jgi:polar amino acid transport system permease protein